MALSSFGFVLTFLTIILESVLAVQDVCMADTFKAQCDPGDVVVMETALYGRMETGTCLDVGEENIGCSNDILYLLDQWCSGKQRCEFIPLIELAKIKSKWCGDMISGYMRADYVCLEVIKRDSNFCKSRSVVTLTQHEGFLASHVTDQTGCGSPSAPWVIEAKPGQTIDISILDFGASTATDIDPGPCTHLYATVFERSLGTNQSICGGLRRENDLYSSRSNTIEIQINTQITSDSRFILHYEIVGCADLSPPAHAWYTRDGNQATIGCDVTERVWHLECHGNRWEGVVGNCTLPEKKSPTKEPEEEPSLYIVLMLSAIVSTTLCLSLLILCVGFCYIRKYRRKRRDRLRETPLKSFYKPGTMDSNAHAHYRPISYSGPTARGADSPSNTTRHQRSISAVVNQSDYSHIWERPLPPNPRDSASGYLLPSAENPENIPSQGGTLPLSNRPTPADLKDSYYCPNTGHKYYVLEKTAGQS